jgi:serine/threonine-protein kinase RsbW
MSASPDVRLALTSKPENVPLVRELLIAVAEHIELGEAMLGDVLTAVTEACNNVVVHAYDGGPGPLEVELRIRPRRLDVLVRDQGCGIVPRIQIDDEGLRGVGLAAIQAFTARAELRGAPDEGTEVRMGFETPRARALDVSVEAVRAAGHQLDLGSEVTLEIGPGELVGPILGRVTYAMGTRAGFSIDRLSDTQLVADTLAANVARALAGPQLGIGLTHRTRELEVLIGPLLPGRGEQLVAVSEAEELGPVIEKLADRLRVVPAGANEVLAVGLLDRRAG